MGQIVLCFSRDDVHRHLGRVSSRPLTYQIVGYFPCEESTTPSFVSVLIEGREYPQPTPMRVDRTEKVRVGHCNFILSIENFNRQRGALHLSSFDFVNQFLVANNEESLQMQVSSEYYCKKPLDIRAKQEPFNYHENSEGDDPLLWERHLQEKINPKHKRKSPKSVYPSKFKQRLPTTKKNPTNVPLPLPVDPFTLQSLLNVPK